MNEKIMDDLKKYHPHVLRIRDRIKEGRNSFSELLGELDEPDLEGEALERCLVSAIGILESFHMIEPDDINYDTRIIWS